MKARSRLKRKNYTFEIFVIVVSFLLGFLGILFILNQSEQEQELLSPIPNGASLHFVEPAYAAEPEPSPSPTPEPAKIAKVTAYSCGGLVTEEEIRMNCPSLFDYPEGRTATGTTPKPYFTVACDRANLGRYFEIEGIGRVKCEDTGGAITGPGRFDLYVSNVDEAWEWGKQYLEYKLIEE